VFINPLHTYPTLERTTAEDGTRFYLDPNTNLPLPSVTTILSHTKDKTFLIEWEKRIGTAKANAIRDEATGLGTLLHTHMECHIQNITRPGGNNLVRQMAARMADVVIAKGLVNVNEVWGYEVPLYFPQLYAGTTDLVGVYKGKPAILDYKNTKKMKTKDMLEDYFCQCVAYALAHNYLFDTDIQQIVIFMVARDLQFEQFVVEGAEFEHYANVWQRRLVEYENTGGPRFTAAGTKVETFIAAPGC
jgi:penicillin-binding protein-related factor A (putative recombinase)